jgi:hypothetical protein
MKDFLHPALLEIRELLIRKSISSIYVRLSQTFNFKITSADDPFETDEYKYSYFFYLFNYFVPHLCS